MKLFGPFRLDSPDCSLWRAGTRVSLAPKAFDVLRHLVDNAGRLVTLDELLDAVWPRTVVNAEAVKKQILAIRKALGDSADQPVFIETVARRGYRFIAQVKDESSTALPGDRGETPIVGREAAIAALDHHLSGALQGRRSIVFVTGEAGIGKTTLVDMFQRRCAARADVRVARGHCVEGFGGKEPYYPVFEALGPLTRDGDGGPFAQLLSVRAPTWLVQFPALIEPERRLELQAETLGATRERMVREMCEALEAWTRVRPLVLVFEDLQWADSSTVDLLSALARRRDHAKLLVLGTVRPIDAAASNPHLQGLEQDLLLHDLCHEIALQPFEASDIERYLQAAFPAPAFPAGFAGVLHRHSNGNALFMREILKELVKRGILDGTTGRCRLSCPAEEIVVGVPATLQQMVDLQFDRLGAMEQRTLRAASVCGRRFSVPAIASALEMPVDRIEEVCDALAASGRFIVRSRGHDGEEPSLAARHEFSHMLYREAVYAGLPEAARTRLHGLVGTRLQSFCDAGHPELASEVTMHLQRAGNHGKAVDYLLRAADNATRRFAYRDAVRTLEDGLSLLKLAAPADRIERELQLLQAIGDIHYWLGAMSESRRAYDRQAALAADAGLALAELNARERLLLPLGFIDPDRGIAEAEMSVRRCAELGDPLVLAHAQMRAAGYRCLYDAWRQDDWAAWTSAAATARNLSSAPLPAYLRSLQRYVLILCGEHRQAVQCSAASQRWVSHAGASPVPDVMAVGADTVALLRCGRLGEVLEVVRTGQELAAKNGTDPWLFVLREAWLRTVLMDFEGARHLCELQLSRTMGHPASQLKTIGLIAEGYAQLERGRHDRAIAAFTEAREPGRTGKFFLHWLWRSTAQQGLCEALLCCRDVSAARLESDGFLDAAVSTADPHLHALALDIAARVAEAEGRGRAAECAMQQALAVLEQSDAPTVAWRVHATAWDLHRHAGNCVVASKQRALAVSAVELLANSFDPGEPLRATFLAARPVQRIFDAMRAPEDAARPRTVAPDGAGTRASPGEDRFVARSPASCT